MRKKIISVILVLSLTFAALTTLTACGETKLAAPQNPDIVYEDGNFVFKWDNVTGADGYLIYFNDDLSNRYYLTENYLPINESEISASLISGSVNNVYIRAVNLNKQNVPINASDRSLIKFNYSKRLTTPTRVSSSENGDVISWRTVNEAKDYVAMVRTVEQTESTRYELNWSTGTTGVSGTVKDLIEGEYLVAIVATADGYEDSLPSEEVEYNNISEENMIKWQVTLDYLVDGIVNYSYDAIEGRTVNLPVAPERDGYEIEGWYLDEYCLVPAELDSYLVTAPTTFFAKWQEVKGEEPGGDQPDNPDNPDEPDEPEDCAYHFDADGDGLCDRCGEGLAEYTYTGGDLPDDETAEDPTAEKITFTVDVSGIDWFGNNNACAYIYVWYEGGSSNAGFPGVKMTLGEDGKYVAAVSAEKPIAGIIISRVSEFGDIWNQTVDITASMIPTNHVIVVKNETDASGKLLVE